MHLQKQTPLISGNKGKHARMNRNVAGAMEESEVLAPETLIFAMILTRKCLN